ncbi:MAG: hypothetical protein JOZ81_04215 [Chloroflexi bacterium]|nr:hypothetical protein [Chloroflexota bacterium]
MVAGRASLPPLGRILALPSSLWPVAGFALAALLIIARRPDAVTHAQFWAEDGSVFYPNVYNHGLLATLAVPHAGYLNAFALLAAAIAQLVPLGEAPLLSNLIAIGAQALPVGLLLSRRAEVFARDIRARVLLAALYVALPGAAETNAAAVNAQWHLAVAALIILLLSRPVHLRQRVLDGGVLLVAGLSGPFSVLLAPLAWLLWRFRPDRLPSWKALLLSVCAAIQIVFLTLLSHASHTGFVVVSRMHPALGATGQGLVKVIGGKTLLTPLVGESAALSEPRAVLVLVGVLGLFGCAWLLWRASADLRIFLLFALGILAVSLWRPQLSSPAWSILAARGGGERYFLIPHLGVLAAIVWAACRAPVRVARVGAMGLLVAFVLLAVPTGWSYPALKPTGFAAKAAAFEHAPRGTVWHFRVNPVAQGDFELVLRHR